MSTEQKTNRHNVFTLAWQFVKRNGMSLSEALKTAWANIKLKVQMQQRIVKFWFSKVDGTLREAYGTLETAKLPDSKGTGRKPNITVQVYFDTEKQEYRCFKKANLVRFA